jgi:DNA-directed RNA polymerase subunit RPC12/RpoP
MAELTEGGTTAHHSYPCEQCGANVEFAAGTGTLTCPYCGHAQEVTPVGGAVREHDFAALAARQRPTAPATQEYQCGTCGAITTSDHLSQKCGFCGSPMVAEVEALGLVEPEAVLPFGVDRASMQGALQKWVRSRWFAPSALKKVVSAEQAHGVYLPHWTFDAQTRSDYTGQRGEHYWVTETYTTTDSEGRSQTQTRQVQKTRWYPASGTVARAFDDVLVAGTRRVMPEHLAKLSPWPLDQATAYQPDYLAGYETLRYDVEPEDGLDVAKQEMAPVINNDCERDIGGDVQQVHHVATSYSEVTYKLLLMPVWIATYLYGGKPFQVLVNARTAEVVGQRPWSAWKITFAVLAALLVIGAIVWAVVASQDGGAASSEYYGLASLLGDGMTRESVGLYADPGL